MVTGSEKAVGKGPLTSKTTLGVVSHKKVRDAFSEVVKRDERST